MAHDLMAPQYSMASANHATDDTYAFTRNEIDQYHLTQLHINPSLVPNRRSGASGGYNILDFRRRE
jgi:hypothetical protein